MKGETKSLATNDRSQQQQVNWYSRKNVCPYFIPITKLGGYNVLKANNIQKNIKEIESNDL